MAAPLKWLARLGLIALGLALSLLVAEALLQVGALVVRWTGRAPPASWATAGARVVCLGDSNTYGLYLDPSDAYPQVLERLLADSKRLPPTEVLNLGFPGTNSSKLRQALPRVVRELRPDVVLVMVGGNDWWTEPEPAPDSNAGPTLADRLYATSRVYRLLYMIGRSLHPPQRAVQWREGASVSGGSGTISYGDAAFEWGWTRRPTGVADWIPRLGENLHAIAAQARPLGVEIVFVTYPSEGYPNGRANALMRAEAQATGTPLIDLAPLFHDTCPDEACEDLFYWDYHPTAKGYRLAAEAIRAWLEDHRG